MQNLKVERLSGPDVKQYISALAALRIKIFHNYPYLYEGNLAYEEKYLKTYTDCPHSVLILVFADNNIVGASTAIPLKYEPPAIQKPFIDAHYDVDKIFYFGESVLLPEYRGNKIGERFFAEREAAAREQGYATTAFCAVKRDTNHPKRPKNFHPLDQLWQRMGYLQHPELVAYMSWAEIGETQESPKPMTFWLKQL